MLEIYNQDCLEKLKTIKDNTIQLVLIDPPYNINKDKRWDKWSSVDLYVQFMGEVFNECQRVLKPNGSMYFFHNDFEQVAKLHNYLTTNTGFIFRSFIIWDKGDFRAISWKNPTNKNTLRKWFNTTEYILYYTFEDYNPLQTIQFDVTKFGSLRDYFKGILNYIGLNKTQVKKRVGESADHCFRYDSPQWGLPTIETYNELIKIFNINKYKHYKTYEELVDIYNEYIKEYQPILEELESRRYIHNLYPNHNVIFRSTEKRNTGKLHPTQKPVDILERLINTSTNEGDTVLDCFMGTGSTGVACVRTGRDFVGIELDTTYYNISKKRIYDELSKTNDVVGVDINGYIKDNKN